MQYKTVVLELLQQKPEIRDELSRQRMLLRTVNAYAAALKARHTAWMDVLRAARPREGESQIASAALEIALQELTDRPPFAPPPDELDPPSLDGAMAFVRRHTPPE